MHDELKRQQESQQDHDALHRFENEGGRPAPEHGYGAQGLDGLAMTDLQRSMLDRARKEASAPFAIALHVGGLVPLADSSEWGPATPITYTPEQMEERAKIVAYDEIANLEATHAAVGRINARNRKWFNELGDRVGAARRRYVEDQMLNGTPTMKTVGDLQEQSPDRPLFMGLDVASPGDDLSLGTPLTLDTAHRLIEQLNTGMRNADGVTGDVICNEECIAVADQYAKVLARDTVSPYVRALTEAEAKLVTSHMVDQELRQKHVEQIVLDADINSTPMGRAYRRWRTAETPRQKKSARAALRRAQRHQMVKTMKANSPELAGRPRLTRQIAAEIVRKQSRDA